MKKLSLQNLDVKDKKVLLRVDFNVPLTESGEIADDTRIRESLPSIKDILDRGGAVILMSHLGRPNGKRDAKFTLKSCAVQLEKMLGRAVIFSSDCIGPEAEAKAKNLKNGEVLLLENLRFYSAEEKPETDPSFAKKLASLGDLYVNDAFGTAHRAHASTAMIASHFRGKAATGYLMEKEIAILTELVTHPKHPFYAIIGGSKISTKIGTIESLLKKVDKLFIGGGMAYTFFKAQGIPIGESIHEDGFLEAAKKFLENKKIVLPSDVIITNRFANDAETKTIPISQGIPEGWQGMDIGPQTIDAWSASLKEGATIFWNGPVGVFEFPLFANGTNSLAKLLSKLSSIRIIGGGDSVAAINQLGLGNSFTHISTGGGATLEFLEFGHLPGIDALSNS